MSSTATAAARRPFNRPAEKHALFLELPLFRACSCGFPLTPDAAGVPICAACDRLDEILTTPWASFAPEFLGHVEGPGAEKQPVSGRLAARTAGSDPADEGSSPSPRANLTTSGGAS